MKGSKKWAWFGVTAGAVMAVAALLVIPALAGPEFVELRGGSSSPLEFAAGSSTENVVNTNKCLANATGSPADLVDFGNNKTGMVDQALGIKSGGSNGTPCSYVDSSEGFLIVRSKAGPWEKVQLDLEAKDNADIRLRFYSDDEQVGAEYRLVTGTAIMAAGLTPVVNPPFPYEATSGPGQVLQQCANPSDSGPDSGPNDNCYWTVVPGFAFDEVRLSTAAGLVSLQGGTDFVGTQWAGQYTSKFWYGVAADAKDDTASTPEDTAKDIDVLVNDVVSTLGTKSILSVADAPNGTTSIVANKVRYQPDPDFNGPDSFSYVLSDGMGGTDTATVSVTVTPVNDPPNAVDDTGEDKKTATEDDTAKALTVRTNDTDIDTASASLTVTKLNGVDGPVNVGGALLSIVGGDVVFNANGSFETLDETESTTVEFDYTLSDGALTDTAHVVVTVNGVNDPPVPNDTICVDVEGTIVCSESTDEETPVVVDLADDVDDDALSVVCYDSLTEPRGVIPSSIVDVSANDGTITYTPGVDFNGTTTFYCEIDDGTAVSVTAVTVNVDVDPVNDAPVAVDDEAGPMDDRVWSGGADVANAESFDVISNDTDVDVGDTLSLGTGPLAPSGIEFLDGDGATVGNLTYGGPIGTAARHSDTEIEFTSAIVWPEDDDSADDIDTFVALVTIPYTVEDGNGGSDTGELVIEVRRVVCSGEFVQDTDGLVTGWFESQSTDSCKRYEVRANQGDPTDPEDDFIEFVPFGDPTPSDPSDDVYFLGELTFSAEQLVLGGGTLGLQVDLDGDGPGDYTAMPLCLGNYLPGQPNLLADPTEYPGPPGSAIPSGERWCWYKMEGFATGGGLAHKYYTYGSIDPTYKRF